MIWLILGFVAFVVLWFWSFPWMFAAFNAWADRFDERVERALQKRARPTFPEGGA